MLVLPIAQTGIKKGGKDIIAMRGINYSDQFSDGDLADSLNLSARRYPYLATRRAREKQTGYAHASAMTAWGKLVVVQNDGTAAVPDYELYYDGTKIGQVSADDGGKKQFAVVNTRLVIWPDKKYLDTTSLTIKSLGASFEYTGATFATDSITFGGGTDLTTLFAAGDGVEITGCTVETGNNKSIVIKGVEAHKITVSPDTFTAATETAKITIARAVPDMDYICESENRLWGCSSSKQTIYASALGDPTNFNVFENLSTDSYALAVGTEGEFTGCARLASSVLFWKENVLHKMLGSYPAEYQMYQYTVEGLRKGCHKSQQVINETLFYMGLHGVYAFAGGTPTLVSPNFGERTFSDAVSGNDGDSYYISCKDAANAWHLFVYETRENIWVHEDNIECVDFARTGSNLYFLDAAGDVWLSATESDDPSMEWLVQFKPFYEIKRTRNRTEAVTERKRYSKLVLRLELPKGSYVTVHVRQDGGPWREISQIVGTTNNIARVRVPMTRCDKFELKLLGKGPCAILALNREYSLGSEV